jgi:hypothetical protein
MHYLHSNPLKKLKISNAMLYERAKASHISSFNGMVSWQDTTTQTSPANHRRN